MIKQKAVFLDRDGVLNKAIIKNGKPYPPNSVNELIIVNDAVNSLLKLKEAGFLLICVTNQPDVARKQISQSTVENINAKIMIELPLDAMFVCFHDDHDACECRKPKPGLLFMAAQQYNINLTKSFMIGDRWRDIEAGKKAGCKAIWLNYNYQEKHPTDMDYTTNNLTHAICWLHSCI